MLSTFSPGKSNTMLEDMQSDVMRANYTWPMGQVDFLDIRHPFFGPMNARLDTFPKPRDRRTSTACTKERSLPERSHWWLAVHVHGPPLHTCTTVLLYCTYHSILPL